jgi:hypothetical protein
MKDFADPRASSGGTPEPEDADPVAALVREAFEENQVRVSAATYLGYQEVHLPGQSRTRKCRRRLIEQFAGRASDPNGGAFRSCGVVMRRRLSACIRACSAGGSADDGRSVRG